MPQPLKNPSRGAWADAYNYLSLFSAQSLNRLTQFTDGAGNVIKYQYDGAGNLTRLTYPEGKTVTYTYDNADRLQTVTDWAGRATQFAYDDRSRLATILFPNQTRRIYGYDSSGRVIAITDKTAEGAVIAYSGLGYDVLDRISSEITRPVLTGTSVSPAVMTFDEDDRLVTWNGQSCASDADGNLTTGPLGGALASFSFDARNRLVGAGGATYMYDAENRRVSVTVSGTTTSLVNDPNAPLSQLLVATRGGGASARTTRYVYANNQLLYEENPGGIAVYHQDYRGSTLALSNDTGQVTDQFNYGSYGEVLTQTGTTSTPFLYNGAYGIQTDPSGLCYMRVRYYSPETRRFLNADPIGFGGGMNWYGFVGGDSVNGVDPFGLKAWTMSETTLMLHQTASSADAGPIQGVVNMLNNHTNLFGGNSAYDFKGNGDTFLVPRRGTMNDGQFGNYIAGFSAGSYGSNENSVLMPALAGTAMIYGGILYDVGEKIFNTDFDAGSRPNILAGYLDAVFIRRHGWRAFSSK